MKKNPAVEFRLCIKNDNYPASLEVRKVYQLIPDPAAAARHLVRIVDEAGEEMLFPEDYFVPIDVPPAAAKVFAPIRDNTSIIRPARRPREGWASAFAAMAERGDDALQDQALEQWWDVESEQKLES